MDVGDGIRVPFEEIFEQGGLPVMVRNPLTYADSQYHTTYFEHDNTDNHLANSKENILQPAIGTSLTLPQMLRTKPSRKCRNTPASNARCKVTRGMRI
jgi:hypothetical protein